MELIIISKKHGTHTVFFDDEDSSLINSFTWYVYKGYSTFYARTRIRRHGIPNNTITMHRMILDVPMDKMVDHRDGNGLNNKRDNIRICTDAQNMCNKKVITKKYSNFLGVFRSGDKWIAGCRSNSILHRRTYDTEKEAALGYNEMAIQFHGQFARLNIIDGF